MQPFIRKVIYLIFKLLLRDLLLLIPSIMLFEIVVELVEPVKLNLTDGKRKRYLEILNLSAKIYMLLQLRWISITKTFINRGISKRSLRLEYSLKDSLSRLKV